MLALSISVFTLTRILPRSSVGLGVTIYAMGFISFYHIYRMIYGKLFSSRQITEAGQ